MSSYHQKSYRFSLIVLFVSVMVFVTVLPIIGQTGTIVPLSSSQPIFAAKTDVCGTITTDTTWDLSGSPWVLTCDVTVAAGVTLTINPGVTVMGHSGSNLTVRGHLHAPGTAIQPIVLTSATDTGPYQWEGLFFDGGSGLLQHVTVRYGGQLNSTSGHLANVILRNVSTNKVRLENCLITQSQYTAIAVENSHMIVDASTISANGLASDHESVFATGSTITVTNSLFQDNAGYGLWTEAGTVLTAANNTFTNNGNYPLAMEPANLHRALSGHTFSGNTPNRVLVETGSIAADTTLPVSDGLEGYELVAHNLDDPLRIPLGTTLTVEPGVKVMGQGQQRIYILGHLEAQGTVEEPIIFTSIDDTEGGTTWRGFDFNGGTGDLQHVIVRYAYGLLTTSIRVRNVVSGVVRIADSQITDNRYTGLYAENSHVVIDNSTISANGLASDHESVFATGSVITVTNSLFQDNAGHGLWTENGTVLNATNNTFTNNGGYPLVMESTNLHRTLAGNIFNENNPNRILVNGDTLIADTSLPTANGLDGYEFTENLTIPDNTTLIVGPGNTLFWRPQQLNVQGNLIAAGIPSSPITFTSRYDDSSSRWLGISIAGGSARLENTTVRYSVGDGLAVADSQLTLHQAALTQNLGSGLHLTGNLGQLLIEESAFVENGYGISNDTGIEVDVRHNWWGHPFGPYHPTLNPDGLGNEVSDDVLFDPWWQTVDGSSRNDLFTGIVGAATASPGQYVDYALSYANYMTETLETAVLIMDLPNEAEYVNSSPEGIYWPERHQVFWKLETLLPDAEGVVSFQVHYAWGIPLELEEQMIAILIGTIDDVTPQLVASPAAPNVSMPLMIPPIYVNYQPVNVIAREVLTLTDIEAEMQTYPEMGVLYQAAMNKGYIYGVAHRLTFDEGSVVTQTVLLQTQEKKVIFLRRLESKVLSVELGPTTVIIEDSTGGLSVDLVTKAKTLFGDWNEATYLFMSTSLLTYGHCFMNCVINQVPTYLFGKAADAAGAIFTSINCGKCALAGLGDNAPEGFGDAVFECESCALAIIPKRLTPGVGEALTLLKCGLECKDDPDTHICTADKQQCSDGGIYGLFGISSIETCICETTMGRYSACETRRTCALNEKCIEGENGPQCSECMATNQQNSADLAAIFDDAPAFDEPDTCTVLDETYGVACHQDSTRIERARDPNAKYGVSGDVIPGQLLTYTITIENEGVGVAYGVFVVDKLSSYLDEATLVIHGTGDYLETARTLVWDIGELASKGDPGSTDVVSFTVRVRPDAASGMVIFNEAVVHFPSVPEETTTNGVVNVVQGLTAVPQMLQTESGHPITIMLQGMDIAGAPLTYHLIDEPLHGEWASMLPTLVYTPDVNFTGSDYFRFVVSNGITESRPAAIQIEVLSAANDIIPPEVIWTSVKDGGNFPEITTTPYLTDTEGSLYAPAILIQFSEAINTGTITTNNITLHDKSDHLLATSLIYDKVINQVAILLREPLQIPQTYTVLVKDEISDQRGNSLTSDFTLHFTTGGFPFKNYLPFIIK